MRKKLTLITAILLCLSLLLIVAGCGGDKDNDIVEGKINITVSVLSDSSELDVMRAFKREYEKTNSLVNIRITILPGDFNQAMTTYVKNLNNIPDIIWVPGDRHSPFTSTGTFVNLRSYYESSPETALENYYDSMIAATHNSPTDDGIWFAPRDYNKPVTFINKKAFQAAGVEIPTQEEWNYEKFIEVCAELRAAMDANKFGNEGYSLQKAQAGISSGSFPVDGNLSWNPIYLSIIESFGGKLIDTSKSPEQSVIIDNASNLTVFKKIYDELIATKYVNNPTKDSGDVFLGAGAAMWWQVRPHLPAISNGEYMDVDFLPMPFEKIGAGCSGYGITTQAKNRVDNLNGNTKNNEELAWDFIKFIITESGQKEFGKSGSGVPVLKSLANDASWTSYISSELNHQAFISYQEKDIYLNDIFMYKPTSVNTVLIQLDTLSKTIYNTSNWDNYPTKINTEIAKVKTNIVNAVK